MSATEINAFIGLATFLVIMVTAIAAVVQLRHLRRANELDGLLSVLGRVEDLGFRKWTDETRRIVAERMPDQEFRRSIVDGTFERADNAWLHLGSSYEWLGSLVRRGLIPEEPIMDIYSGRIISAWLTMRPIVALLRRKGSAAVLENFEYLYMRAERFSKIHPALYPRHMPHAELPDEWAEADAVGTAAA